MSTNLIRKTFAVGNRRSTRITASLRKKQMIGLCPKGGKRSPLICKQSDIEFLGAQPEKKDVLDVVPIYAPNAIRSDGSVMDIWEFCETYNIPKEHVKSYKLVTHIKGYWSYNIQTPTVSIGDNTEWMKRLLETFAEHAPQYPEIKYDKFRDPHLLIVDPADIHIGKLSTAFESGDTYNAKIAVQRVLDGVDGLIKKAKGFDIEQIVFVGGNDILHTDANKKATTAGTPQDTDGMWYENFLTAKKLYVDAVEMLLGVAPVHYIHCPSNHDWVSGFFLSECVKTHFKNSMETTFDCDMKHRKYYTYGDNLIGFTHADSAKPRDLPLIMADESPDWSRCKLRYIYGHHVHSKHADEWPGVEFETLRSPSGTDGWHHRNGYVGAKKAVEAFIHHKEYGQVSRLTHIFRSR